MTVIFNQAPPEELVDKHASELAKALANDGRNATGDSSKTQLRKFYQEYNNIRNYVCSQSDSDEAFKKRLVTLKMLIAKAEYARGRKSSTNIPEQFINWFVANIRAIKSADDVEKFGDYFEALIGFFYSANADNNQQAPRPNNFNNQNNRR